MKQLFTIFVVAQVFAHSALGCCSHHEHASGNHRGNVPSASAKVCAGNSHCDRADHHTNKHQEGRHEGDESNPPCDGMLQCEGESCRAILPDSTPHGQPFDSQVDLWQIVPPLPADLMLAGAADAKVRRPIDETWAPVRAHLFFQILLI